MNKTNSILAISCLGLMATSAANAAKVIEDKLEVYGKAHLAVENYSPDVGDGTTDLKSIDSRIGFKGKLPLDGDLKAVYKYEFGVDISDESTSSDGKDFFKNRSQYVGLAGGFGTVLLGRNDTPLKQLEGKIDQFGDTYADIGKVFDAYVDSQERENNFIGYYSPKFGQFQIKAATMPGKETGAEIGDAFSTALVYGDKKLKKSSFYAGIGYDSAVDGEDTSVLRLSAATKFGSLGIGAIIENADDGNETQNRYAVSASYKINKLKLKAQYVAAEEVGTTKESNLYAFGADYKLGKYATVYAQAASRDIKGTEDDYVSAGIIVKF